MDIANQHKQRELKALLERGVVMVHLDPRIQGVVVPPQFAQEAALRLNVAYAFKLPAFEISDDGVYAILSFNRQNFGCTIPWRAVYALTLPDESHEGMVWPDSMPLELKANEGSAEPAAARVPDVPDGDTSATPAFSVLPGGKDSDNPRVEEVIVPDAESSPTRSHLTLIKS